MATQQWVAALLWTHSGLDGPFLPFYQGTLTPLPWFYSQFESKPILLKLKFYFSFFFSGQWHLSKYCLWCCRQTAFQVHRCSRSRFCKFIKPINYTLNWLINKVPQFMLCCTLYETFCSVFLFRLYLEVFTCYLLKMWKLYHV